MLTLFSFLNASSSQIQQLKADLDKAKESRRHAQDESASLRMQLEQHLEAAAVAEEEAGTGGAGLDEAVETVPSLREKVKRLERDLRLAQAGSTTEGGAVASVAEGAEADSAKHEVAIIQQELDDVRQQKKQREEALLATKKQLAEVQYELVKAQVLYGTVHDGGSCGCFNCFHPMF